ncbi:MAG: TonB-dependent receptor plug domain-containing protein [Opitutaceae bacterium]
MTNPLLRLGAFVSFLAGVAAGFAQSAVPAPKPADGTVVLSPFEVTAENDVGYQAANTAAGSRLNAKLKDTAAPITVFTAEFLSDFGLTNIEEMLGYSANFEKDFEDSNAGFNAPSQRGTSAATAPFRVRGLAGSFAVDLVESAVPQDAYNIDRVELSSGPNAVLFGLGAAGGTVSLTSKQANVRRNSARGKFTFGSWNFQRAEFDANRALIKDTLGFRLNLLDTHQNGFRSYDFNKSRRAAASVTYQPFKTTVVRLAWDGGTHGRHTDWPWPVGDGVKGWFTANRPTINSATTPFNAATFTPLGINRVDTAVHWTFLDNSGFPVNTQNQYQSFTGQDASGTAYATDGLLNPNVMAPYSFSGPGSFLAGSYRNYSAKIEQRWGKLVVEGAFISTFNKSRANGWAVPGNSINLRGDPNQFLPLLGGPSVANPNVGRLYIENTWRPEDTAFKNEVFRLTAAYEWDLGKFGRHRLAGLAETGKVDQIRHVFQEILVNQNNVPINNVGTPENATNQLFRRHYTTEGQFDTYYMSDPRIAFTPFTVGANTYRSRYIALNQNNNGEDLKLTDTFMLATQNYFWKDRVITTLGYRQDRVKFKSGVTARLAATDPGVLNGTNVANEWAGVPGQFDRNTLTPHTFTAGVVVHVTTRFSVFYNQSDNVGAPAFNARILPPIAPPASIQPPPTKGESKDFGVKIDLFGDERFFLQATRFDSTYLDSTPVLPGTNPFQPAQGLGQGLNALVAAGRITEAQAAPFRVNPGAFSVDVASKGYEVEAIANPNRNLTLRAAFSYSDRNRENFVKERDPFVPALYTFLKTVNDTGVAPITLNGLTRSPKDTITGEIDNFFDVTGGNQLQAFGSRPYKFNVNGRYRFTDGALKGFAVGGAVRWAAANYMQEDQRTTVLGAPNPNLGKKLYGHTQELWDFFTTYRTKLRFFGDHNVSFQLNVRNAFNQSRVLPAKYTGDFTALRRVYLNDPRSFRFSTEIDF